MRTFPSPTRATLARVFISALSPVASRGCWFPISLATLCFTRHWDCFSCMGGRVAVQGRSRTRPGEFRALSHALRMRLSLSTPPPPSQCLGWVVLLPRPNEDHSWVQRLARHACTVTLAIDPVSASSCAWHLWRLLVQPVVASFTRDSCVLSGACVFMRVRVRALLPWGLFFCLSGFVCAEVRPPFPTARSSHVGCVRSAEIPGWRGAGSPVTYAYHLPRPHTPRSLAGATVCLHNSLPSFSPSSKNEGLYHRREADAFDAAMPSRHERQPRAQCRHQPRRPSVL